MKRWIGILIGCLSSIVSAQSDFSEGIIVHIDSNDGRATVELLKHPNSRVHGLDTNEAQVKEARRFIQSKNLYGTVSVSQFDGVRLPYANNLVNRIVAPIGTAVPLDEMMRVLVPLGTIQLGDKSIVKPWPKEMDQWTHFLRDVDNNAVSSDSTIDLPRSLQWVDGPRWARSHEEFASISAVVSAQGRLFYIADKAPLATLRFDAQWTLVARDAFNGIKLWNRTIPVWNDHLREFRSGPAHLPRRLVAVGNRVYVTLGYAEPVSELDAQTGEVLRTYKGTEFTEEILVKDGVLYVLSGSSESLRAGHGLFERNEPSPSSYRRLMAVNAKSGKVIWAKDAKGPDFILPMGIAWDQNHLYFNSIRGIGCLDARTGKEQWLTERPSQAKRYGFSAPTLVVKNGVVLLADRQTKGEAAKDDVQWAVAYKEIKDTTFQRKGESAVTAYDAKSGAKLWSAPCGEGFNSPTDVFVINDVVWLGPFNKKMHKANGLDLRTGAVVKTIDVKGEKVGMLHDRCYRQKASVKYIFGGRDGIEFFDLEKGWIRNNSWIRGTCQYGIMPANGLMYAPSDACACHSKNRLQGFNVLSSRKAPSFGKEISETGRFVKGPAFGATSFKSTIHEADWPVYRYNAERGSAGRTTIPLSLKRKWKRNVGGRLTQPVSAHGLVYVAAADQHSIYAFDKATGTPRWNFVTGGRIDSAPSLYKGLLLTGSADGKVYCMDALSGKLVWSFRAAPEERLMMNYGQLESSWPVHGSVLLKNDAVCFTAGRSSYIDGGLYFYRLDPLTGKLLTVKNITSIDPLTEASLEKEIKFDSGGTISDLLSADADTIYLKHLAMDENGETKKAGDHLFSAGGFLGEEWFVRAFWQYGREMYSGWGGWAKSARQAPFGRIMGMDKENVYGYGRTEITSKETGHRAETYHLYSLVKPSEATKVAKKPKGQGQKGPPKNFVWSNQVEQTIRALALSPQHIVTAGVPNLGKKTKGILAFENNQEALDAYEGRKGGLLRIYSKESGVQLAEYTLSAAPVFDGLSIATQEVLISLKDGTVECWGE